ncbi:MAG: DUF1553 domain-containing protein [Leptospiraceae bacterium]|nr:DUF1553 domain-containing protein [Leptospiraceae bacterium]
MLSKKLFSLFTISIILVGAGAGGSSAWSSTDSPLDQIYRDAAGQYSSPADELALLRRLSLQIRGLPPSIAEIKEFEAAESADKLRYFAIRYLRDPAYAQYWATRFGSTLREQTRQRGVKEGSFYKYLSDSLHQNKSYKTMVSEMLLSSGSSAKNGAVGFILRDEADPLQVAEYVGRVFYGSRLACARCHDHPFRRDFTRRDYYGFAAFFSQLYVQKNLDSDGIPRHRMEDLSTAERKRIEQEQQEWRQNVWNKMSKAQRDQYMKKHKLQYMELKYEPALELRFPHTDDQPGGDLVKLKYPDGSRALVRDGEDRREAFVDWLTDAENDRFRKVLINRIWTAYMGWSFFTPFDDWNPDTKLRHPEILNHLDKYFLEHDYRIKDLVLYIVSSKAWQRRAATPDDQNGESADQFFQPYRMDPSQLFNSLVVGSGSAPVKHIWERAAKVSPEGTLNLSGVGSPLQPKDQPKDLGNACQAPRPLHSNTFLALFGDGSRMDVDDDNTAPTIDQVLALYNGRVTGQVIDQFRQKDNWLMKEYDQHQDIMKSMDTLYVGLLGRHMQADEKALLQRMTKSTYGKRDRKFNIKVIQNLTWSLINSHEFIHVY